MQLTHTFFRWRRHLDASAAVLSVLFAGYTTLFMDSSSWSLALWWGAALLSVVMFIADPMGRIAKRFTPARHTTSR